MALLDAPENVDDLSNEKGFQWNFHCDVCRSGYTTTFIPSKSANTARRFGFLSSGLSALGSIGGTGDAYGAGQAVGAAGQFKGMSADWHREHDGAFQQAVNEAKVHFKKCPRCKHYVCADDWNDEAGLCTQDAPSLAAEMQATKAQERVLQMQAQVKSQKLFDGDTSDQATLCPTCGKPSGTGKFCQNCGASLGYKVCAKCQHPNPPTVNFCGECGNKLG